MNNPIIDEVLKRFGAALPPGTDVLKEDLESNLRAALHAAFAKLDLVTREEFEVQSQVLQRSRAKLEQLEKTVAELEKSVVGS